MKHVAARLTRSTFSLGVILAAHFAPLSLTREQRERLLLAMAGRDRSEVEWVEEMTFRFEGRTTPGDWQLWVTVFPAVDEARRAKVDARLASVRFGRGTGRNV